MEDTCLDMELQHFAQHKKRDYIKDSWYNHGLILLSISKQSQTWTQSIKCLEIF